MTLSFFLLVPNGLEVNIFLDACYFLNEMLGLEEEILIAFHWTFGSGKLLI